MIDSHAHLLPEYFRDDEIEGVLERAREAGVSAVVNVGTRLDDSAQAIALAAARPEVWATAGVHPHEAAALTADALVRLRELLRQPRVVAVGECGLDYHYDHAPRDVQREALRLQVRLARECGLPLVLHNRDSDDDLVTILTEEGAEEVGGVVHAFSTSVDTAKRCLDLGFHLGFGGMITFAKADNVRAALAATPLERLLLETDAPYLTPVPHRGSRNEPARVAIVAARAALERGVDLEGIAEATAANTRRLFRLPAA